MGQGIQAGQEASQGHQLSVHPDHQAVRSGKTRRRARKRKKLEAVADLGEKLAETVEHFFPQFGHWLRALPDQRQQGKVIYEQPFCIWSALLIFLQALGSRRQFDREAQADATCTTHLLLENLNQLAGTDAEDILHGDALNDYLCQLPAEATEAIPQKMVARLIRMRALDFARFFGYYLIAIDATGISSSATRHCPYCLSQKHNGKSRYYHLVLEAKLITPDGMVFSIGSEFIENADPTASKQDCELAALPRLAAKIKEHFPRLRICLLLDGLYANQNVFALCSQYDWRWIITFKEGRLPTAFCEFQTLKTLRPQNVKEIFPGGRYQRLSWINDLEHEGHGFGAFDCLTYNDEFQQAYFAWITDLRISADRVGKLANHGGRKRWTIENQGFNNQKNQGFELQHAYSQDTNAAKNYYLILQIAHTILQLMVRGNVATAFKVTICTMKNFFIRLRQSLRFEPIQAAPAPAHARPSIQIRLAPT